ncbi:MAG TPA: undecaprenyl-phosphate galactose phosphotransferase WbaP [Bryobacteraceae bacterium]|nr:undecaprenyl-phosphate galactose phosphotransferase WbaP [Bryobacteraceae bacterium]
MSTSVTAIDEARGSCSWADSRAAARHVVALRSPQYSAALTVTALGLTDLSVLLAVFLLSTRIWSLVKPAVDVARVLTLWPFAFVVLAVYMASGLYRVVGMNAVEELRRSILATSLAFLVLAGIALMQRGVHWLPRTIVILTWLLVSTMLPFARAATRKVCGTRKWFGRSVIVLGAGKAGEDVIRALQKSPGFGLKPVAVLDDDPAAESHICGVAVLGRLALAPALASAGFRYGILAMPDLSRANLLEVIREYGHVFDRLLLIPDLLGMSSLWVEATDLGGILGLEIHNNLLHLPARILKRVLDLVVVAACSPLLVPAFCMIGCLIKLTSRGPLFFGHARIGYDGRTFKAWKFRTMVRDADAVLQRHLAANRALAEEWRLTHKLKRDPRVTRVGRLLRRASLDELPQLLNVLKGEMSLVGPRPIVALEVERYGENYPLYCRVKPGITGLWQVSGRNNTTYPERVAYDQYYVRNWSVWLDLYILKNTVRTVLTGDGAY